MQKNVASQKWYVFAFDRTTSAPVTGDALNITGKLSIDYGAATAITDTNPAEVEDGYYVFDLTQAETNGDHIAILPESGTANVVVIGAPATVQTVPASFPDGVVQTGDSYALIGATGSGLTSLASAANLATATTHLTDIKGTGWVAADNLAEIAEDVAVTVPGLISGLNNVAATDIVSNGAITTLAGAVVNVDTVDVTTTNSDMRGTDNAALASSLTTTDGKIDSILTDTGTTLPAQISGVETKVDTVDTVVDSVKVDTAAILADTGTDGVVISTAQAQSIADEILKRSVATGEATAAEHSLATIVLAILESSRSTTTWTIKRTDGTTTHATKTLSLDQNADPVIGVQ